MNAPTAPSALNRLPVTVPPLRRSSIAKSRFATASTITGIASTAIAISAVTTAPAISMTAARMPAAIGPKLSLQPNSDCERTRTSGFQASHAIPSQPSAATTSGNRTSANSRALKNTGTARRNAEAMRPRGDGAIP